MTSPQPIYRSDNTKAAYQLDWSLSVFWHGTEVDASRWLDQLKSATEPDGVRILEHRLEADNVSQFFVSTIPGVAPSQLIRSIKGRLQHSIRSERPKAFRRNYSLHSIGSATRETVEEYVASQTNRHVMADPRVQAQLEDLRVSDESVDLGRIRRSGHGEFRFNLHVVFARRDREIDLEPTRLRSMQDMIVRCAEKKGHLLSRASIVADHLHMTLGCGVSESPEEIALAYMNNLAFSQGMKSIFEFSYYVGTIGEYDRGAVRRGLAASRRPTGTRPAEAEEHE